MRVAPAVLLLAAAATACNAFTGVDDVEFGALPSGGGTGGTSATTGAAGAPGGAGTGGSAGGRDCTPGETGDCYSGPPGTRTMGLCVGGTHVCDARGAFGPCTGEITPGVETCVTPGDEDCDGLVDEDGEGCSCAPGAMQPCYGGPAGTQDVGICVAGTQQCDSDGNGWGPCIGQITPAAEDCGAPLDEDCSGLACSETIWAVRFGDGGDQRVDASAFDGLGNVYVTGRFSGTITFGATSHTSLAGDDVYLVKLDAQGAPVWSKQFGGPGNQNPRALAVDAAGNVVSAGGFDGTIDLGGAILPSAGAEDMFVAKHDPLGNHVWSAAYGSGGGQILNAAALLSSGDVIVTGNFAGSVDLGNGNLTSSGANDVLVARLASASGAAVWSKSFGAGGEQIGFGVAVDGADDAIVIGYFNGNFDLGGGLLVGGGVQASFVAKLAGAGGDHVWSKAFSPSFQIFLRTGATDAQGNVVVIGELDGTVDMGGGPLTSAGADDAIVAKLDANGAHTWSKIFGDAADQYAIRVAVDPAGSAAVIGRMAGTADFGGGALVSPSQYAPFVTMLDAQGAHVWSRLFGTGGDDASLTALATNIARDPVSGRLAVAFHTGPAIDMGTGVLPAAGNFDAVVAAIAP